MKAAEKSSKIPTPDEQREAFIKINGYWTDAWQAVLTRDPEFFNACIDFMAAPSRLCALDRKTVELVNIAANVACTHLNEQATRVHIRRALEEGATAEEVGAVFQLVSVLGIHSCNVGVPLLVEEARGQGLYNGGKTPNFNDYQLKIKEEFITKRGYWSPLWDDLLYLSPDFFASYTRFSSYPAEANILPPKLREFIYIAIDIATQHLFEPGTRVHFANALKHGASVADILEVIEIVSLIGLQSASTGYSILGEELANSNRIP